MPSTKSDHYLDSSSVVIVVYPTDYGGKFLINSLGLSDGCYFQHKTLVRKQRDNQFTQKDKLDFLLSQLSRVTDRWNDLNLGCTELFCNPIAKNEWDNDEYDYSHIFDPTLFHSNISVIANESTRFFVAAHCEDYFHKLISIWPNSTTILFDESSSFLNWRYTNVPTMRSDLYTIQWDQYRHIKWNGDWYLDRQVFLNKIKELYDDLGLTDFNLDYVSRYYDEYIATLQRIRHDFQP